MDYDYFMCKNQDIDVDIMMITYNHEKYVSQAIESILLQKTKYNYRIIIGEDCSTDSTREIVMSYYKQYPDKIAAVLWKKNVGCAQNAFMVTKLCSAPYVANLEGDDYWTDPLKLEKQISFLEEHSDFIGTSHNIRCVDNSGELLHRDSSLYAVKEEYIYDKLHALNMQMIGQTASLLYRNFWKQMTEEDMRQYMECKQNVDVKINMLLGINGKSYFFRDIMADHRRVFTGDSWTAYATARDMRWNDYVRFKSTIEYMKYLLAEKELSENDLNKLLFDSLKWRYEESIKKFLISFDRNDLKIMFRFLCEMWRMKKKRC